MVLFTRLHGCFSCLQKQQQLLLPFAHHLHPLLPFFVFISGLLSGEVGKKVKVGKAGPILPHCVYLFLFLFLFLDGGLSTYEETNETRTWGFG